MLMTLEKSQRAIGLFGGSFNPPHVAHVLAVGWALSVGGVDEVWIIPTGGHPFGKPLAPFEDRLEMCRLAFGCFGERVKIRDIEREERVHYSVETVKALAEKHPENSWRWIMGSDALAESDQWRDFAGLVRLAPLLVVRRLGRRWKAAEQKIAGITEGATISSFALPDLNSTMVRKMLAGDSGARRDLEGLVPNAVLRYIRQRHLYSGQTI